ncbi:MAG: pre-16S rRNA-processing nuclease YqgF [Armatimonadetes bacterium]|nr:pre-16S rRNA-processing nuclease YqgF [Armatimonadota bacterium]MDE2205292.1 pre-16S rRNA-processing nuclease YqgF [Armatimonadota bacterium]
MTVRRVLSVDPGTGKCGVAVLEAPATVLWHGIVPRTELRSRVIDLLHRFCPDCILVGNGTGSRDATTDLRAVAGKLPVIPVPERNSSERARARCVAEQRPRGWQRMLPRSLRTPNEPYDDVVAVILAEEYLTRELSAAAPGG